MGVMVVPHLFKLLDSMDEPDHDVNFIGRTLTVEEIDKVLELLSSARVVSEQNHTINPCRD